MNNRAEQEPVLKPYLSRLGAFSLALGTSIGWGSLVVTNNEYLAIAGPAGSIAGMVIGALVMLLMARNFFYLVSTFRDAGGVYAYVKSVFGYDRAFLISWFLGITYIAMLWANATSVPLFARYLAGDTFCFGQLYTVFGYRVYFGEVLLMLGVSLFFTVIAMNFKRLTQWLMIGTAGVFTAGIACCFAGAFFLEKSAGGGNLTPVCSGHRSAPADSDDCHYHPLGFCGV